MTSQEIIQKLRAGNAVFAAARAAPVGAVQTIDSKASPIAAIITCSDLTDAPESIFSAAPGELMVLRTAGNVISDYGAGTIEYAAGRGVSVVIVLGHTHCGAVGAARQKAAHHNASFGRPHGQKAIMSEISRAIHGSKTALEAVRANVNNSVNRLMENPELLELLDDEKIDIFKAVYDLETGKVEFFI